MKLLTIRNKLIIGAFTPIALLLIISFIGTGIGFYIQGSLDDIFTQEVALAYSLEEMKFNASRVISSTNEVLLDEFLGGEGEEEGEAGELEENERAQVAEAVENLNFYLAAFQRVAAGIDEDDIAIGASLETEVQALVTQSAALLELQESGASESELLEAREAFEAVEQSLLAELSSAVLHEQEEVAERQDSISTNVRNSGATVGALNIAAIAVSLALFGFINRSINKPLTSLQETTARFGAGDLSQRATVLTQDEIGELARTFNQMADDINQRQVALADLNATLEQRVAERTAELSELAERERLILENLPGTAVMLLDTDFNILLMEGQEVTNAPVTDQPQATNLRESIPPEGMVMMEAILEKVKAGEIVPIEAPYGDQYYSASYVPLRNAEGKVDKMLSVNYNITERRRSEQAREELIKELRAARRIAEENSRLKSEFLATMSHELRTPMNAIEGFAGIMMKRMAGVEYNDPAGRYIAKIRSNSQRLLNLINDFLDLSRIEAGRLELAHSAIIPREMAAKWKENLGVLAENKDIALEVNTSSDMPEVIYGDEESITKIAINLIGNAIKFTETGSVNVQLSRRADQMCLEVRDTGIGIPPHAREFIFDEFRQVDQSSKRLHGGTGLGLAIVQKLARAMNGTVTVDSEVGVGSTFTVLLPLHTSTDQTQPQITEGVA